LKYNNFKLALYCPAPDLNQYDKLSKLEEDISFFQKYLKLHKVYLETHRNNVDVPREKMLNIIEIFNKKDINIAGGITPTIIDDLNNDGSKRFFNVFCYTNDKMRDRIKGISEYTASLFDEFILDDFFFTNCACPSCIEAKGSKSWQQFRLDLMNDVSKNLIIEPAKK